MIFMALFGGSLSRFDAVTCMLLKLRRYRDSWAALLLFYLLLCTAVSFNPRVLAHFSLSKPRCSHEQTVSSEADDSFCRTLTALLE